MSFDANRARQRACMSCRHALSRPAVYQWLCCDFTGEEMELGPTAWSDPEGCPAGNWDINVLMEEEAKRNPPQCPHANVVGHTRCCGPTYYCSVLKTKVTGKRCRVCDLRPDREAS